MRELAIKKSQFASALNDETEDRVVDNPVSLKRLFHGWLREVPRPHRSESGLDRDNGIRRVLPADPSPGNVRQLQSGLRTTPKWRILTIREVLGLTRATVRESEEHRTWPPEVILKFMAAEVVTRKDHQR